MASASAGIKGSKGLFILGAAARGHDADAGALAGGDRILHPGTRGVDERRGRRPGCQGGGRNPHTCRRAGSPVARIVREQQSGRIFGGAL